MAKGTGARREALRARLVEAARDTIAAEGIDALRARNLAEAAGCSVGAIYTVFGDLHALVLAVNGGTFAALGAHVRDGVRLSGAEAPTERLIALSNAYLDFAATNPRLWQALFDVEMRAGGDVPDWYAEALDGLLAIIDAPLRDLFPDADDDTVRLRTRTLFSAVHGIVLLGVEQRISGVRRDRLPEMIRFLLTAVTNGEARPVGDRDPGGRQDG